MLPGGLAMGLLAPLVGRLFDRVGPRPLLVPGLSAVGVGIGIMSRVPEQPWLIVAGHVVMSLGLAFVFTPLMTTAMGSLPRQRYGHGSAIVGTVQQVAGAAGAALLVSIMARVAAGTVGSGGTELEGISDGTSAAFTLSAALGLVTVVIALFVRRSPEETPAAEDAPAGASPEHDGEEPAAGGASLPRRSALAGAPGPGRGGHSAPLPAFSRARSAKLTPIAARVSAMMMVSAMMNASSQALPLSVREKMIPGIIAVPIAAPVR